MGFEVRTRLTYVPQPFHYHCQCRRPMTRERMTWTDENTVVLVRVKIKGRVVPLSPRRGHPPTHLMPYRVLFVPSVLEATYLLL